MAESEKSRYEKIVEYLKVKKKQLPATEKVCPLTFSPSYGFVKCLEEKCAWWDKEVRACVLHRIAQKL